MRILVFARSTTAHALAGGMEQQYESLMSALIARGHEISLVTTSGMSAKDELPAYEQMWLAAGGNGRYSFAWWIATASSQKPWRSHTWDLVLSVSFAGGAVTFWKDGPPVVAQVHGTSFAELQSSMGVRSIRELVKLPLNVARIARELLILRRAKRVVAVSANVETQLQMFPYSGLNLAQSVISNGVEQLDSNDILRKRRRKRMELNISEYEVVFVFSGRLHAQKGVHDAIEAFGKVRSGRLLIAGSGPEEGAARAAAATNSDISFFGRLGRAELEEVYAAGDVLLFPSKRKEGLPMVLLESAAAGLPALVYSGCGVPGELYPGLTLVSADPESLAREMSRRSPDGVRSSLLPDALTLSRMAEAYEICFASAMEGVN